MLGPTLTISPQASAVTADPRPLFWVAGIVLGALALWVLNVLVRGEDRGKPVESASKPSSDGAE